MSPKHSGWVWCIGVIVGAGFVSWLPYWGWNLLGGIPGTAWWRVPVVTPGLFDTYVYLHWMAAAAEALPYGGHLKWFGGVLQVLWELIGRGASLPELWIVSRWFTFALTLFVGAWVYERWGGLERTRARWLSVAFFCAVVLTLGMRPGIYAWYMPFAAASLVGVLFTSRALEARRYVPAAAWSVASVALSWIYPWFFLFSGLWLAVLWGMALLRLCVWAFPALAALGAIGTFFVAAPAARWFLDPARAGLIGEYERNGMVFARVPFFSNTVLAIGAWIIFLYALVRREPDADQRHRLIFLNGGWITMLLLWFHTPFTGLFTYSDHLISPVTVFAWISLAVVWRWTDEASPRAELNQWLKWIPAIIALCSTGFFVYILQQPLRFNVFKFDSYIVHLAHWLALAVATGFAAWKLHHPSFITSTRVLAAIVAISIAIGLGGWLPMFIRDIPRVKDVQSRTEIVSWVRTQTGSDARLCADPETATFYAAHTGRRVFPAEATLSWPDPSPVIIRDLATVAGAYDVHAANAENQFRFYTDHYRTIACADESKYSHNALYARVLELFGFHPDQVNDLIGCDTRTLEKNRVIMDAAIQAHALNADAFRAVCPSVMIPATQRTFWTLPSDYVEHRVMSDFSVWQTP